MTYSRENRTSAYRHHADILEALEARDAAEAQQRMKTHIEWARDVAIAHLQVVRDGDGSPAAPVG
jgi:DNA-binding GntR family transcriptional regulator